MIDGKGVKNVHYCDEKFSNLSIDQLLSYRGDTPFDQQVVMCIDQQGVYTKNTWRPNIDPSQTCFKVLRRN